MLRIASILDEFTKLCLAPLAYFDYLKPNNIYEQFSGANFSFVLVESAWLGNQSLWKNLSSQSSKEIEILLAYSKELNLPSVFWCKEDPVHFHRFLATASHFDFVFTTDIDCVPLYKRLLGHNRVYLLPFACSPALQNPLETFPRDSGASFAGSFYHRYPKRVKDLDSIIEAVDSCSSLRIYDRYAGSSDGNYQFPEKYKKYIQGSLPYDQIDRAYKGYRYSINLNTIQNSPTMFARRVFELLASGTVVISNYSKGLPNFFGDLIISSDDSNVIGRRLDELEHDDILRMKIALGGLRKVMREHTYAHRLNSICNRVFGVGQHYFLKPALPRIQVLCFVNSSAEFQKIETCLRSQAHGDWLALIINANSQFLIQSAVYDLDPRIQCHNLSDVEAKVLGDLMGTDVVWLSCMTPSDYYGPHYLLDFAIATHYSEAQAFHKGGYFAYENQEVLLLNEQSVYKPTSAVRLRSSLISAKTIQSIPISELALKIHDGQHQVDLAYALDCFSYCQNAFENGLDIEELSALVDDLSIDSGQSMDSIDASANAVRASLPSWVGKPSWSPTRIADAFGESLPGAVTGKLDRWGWYIQSDLPDLQVAECLAQSPFLLKEFPEGNNQSFLVEAGPGLPMELLIRFEDENQQFLASEYFPLNERCLWSAPQNTRYVRLGLRIVGSGATRIMRWVF